MVNESTTRPFNLYIKSQFNGRYLPALLVILLIISYIFSIDKGFIEAPSFLVKKIEVKKEVKIEKEVIKYIEKDTIPTEEFIIHFNPRVDPVIAKEIGMAVNKYSKKYQLPIKLVLSIIKKESSFNPFAKSSVAFGLMQIYPKYHKDKIRELGIKDNRKLYHIDNNVNIGCRIISDYLKKENNDLNKALHDYLSKSATENQKNKYINEILISWSEMNFMEFKRNEK